MDLPPPPKITPFQYSRFQTSVYSPNGEPKLISPSQIGAILGISPVCTEPSGVYMCIYKGSNFSIYCYFKDARYLTNWQQRR